MSKFKLIFTVLLLGLLALPVVAEVELEVGLEDLGVEPGVTSLVIPVDLMNTTDTINEFMIYIQLNRPDIIGLEQVVDTTNTLISGWEYLEVLNIDGWSNNLFIHAKADLPNPPQTTTGIFPQTFEKPLINIHTSVYELDSTLPDQTVDLMFNNASMFQTVFTNNHGETLGVQPDTIYYPNYFICEAWADDICLFWSRVSNPPYDSMYVDTVPYYVPDPEVFAVNDGSVTVMLSLCGDANGDGVIDITDVTFLISSLYLDGDPPPVLRTANVDSSPDGVIDIADITYIIAHLYLDHRELNCPFIPPHD